MDHLQIVRLIVEKSLRYISPDLRSTALLDTAAPLSNIVRPQEIDKFVDRLGVESRMMDMRLHEPVVSSYLRKTQCANPIYELQAVVYDSIVPNWPSSQLPDEIDFARSAEEGEASSEASYDGGKSQKWIEDVFSSVPPSPKPAAPVPVPPPPPPMPAAAATPVVTTPRESDHHKLARTKAKRPMLDGREYDATIVNVFYATDRRRATGSAESIQYDWQQSPAGKLEYGECEISIPDTHVMGGMESPSLLRFEFRPNPDKHIVLMKTTSVEEEQFYDKVKASVAQSDQQDAFVFIHGYNVSFEDAARRTGQFAFDLKFVGAPILYSWPSNGGFADYMKDENNIIWSTPHFETFLHSLSQRIGAERIHIIAHSMGNRAVCEALRALSYDPALQLKLTHLVLAAPDIDAGTFSELAATLQKHAAHVTLYESSNDKALMASKKLHGNPRAGEPLLLIAGMDTIDASTVDTDFLGHSYWSKEWLVMADINTLLDSDQPAAKRFGLLSRENSDGEYFVFQKS